MRSWLCFGNAWFCFLLACVGWRQGDSRFQYPSLRNTVEGEKNFKAATGKVAEMDRCAVQVDDLLDHRETEAVSAFPAFGGEKRVKNLRQIVFRDAWPVVT